MEQQLAQLSAQMTILMNQMRQQTADFTERIASLEQQNTPQELVLYDEVKLNISDPKDIDLELFKFLPKFDGIKEQIKEITEKSTSPSKTATTTTCTNTHGRGRLQAIHTDNQEY
ncbi:unnamed protein product [Ceratitis capitata]|uniref:(Mediterranean fruit fly) hypothetical protein n=1 Tax=Ceratitis capitata TaxID=7213 RepID=A0A811UYI9_CERCA|nr:unnamed protein product [Ceratitis capitata]